MTLGEMRAKVTFGSSPSPATSVSITAEMRSFYVYIMTNRSGTLYVGVTNDLQRRVAEHRSGLGSFTGRYRVVKLIYYESASAPYPAISREKEIKGWTREKKLSLIRGANPAMKDLAPQLFGWRAAQFSVTRRSS